MDNSSLVFLRKSKKLLILKFKLFKNKDNINHLYFITNVNEKILLTKNNPLEIKINSITEEPSPYIFVRKNLKALISRSVFYELIELATKKNIDGKDCLVLASAGEVFKLYEY